MNLNASKRDMVSENVYRIYLPELCDPSPLVPLALQSMGAGRCDSRDQSAQARRVRASSRDQRARTVVAFGGPQSQRLCNGNAHRQLAMRANTDPIAYRQSLLSPDAKKLKACPALLQEKTASWRDRVPRDHAVGIACHERFETA